MVYYKNTSKALSSNVNDYTKKKQKNTLQDGYADECRIRAPKHSIIDSSNLKNVNELEELYKLNSSKNLLIIMIYVLLVFCVLVSHLEKFGPNYYFKIRCFVEDLVHTNFSFEQLLNLTSPRNFDRHDGCYYYDCDYVFMSTMAYENARDYFESCLLDKPVVKRCQKYVYHPSIDNKLSPVQELDMICDQDLFYYSQKYKCVAVSIVSLTAGIVADTIGRRPTFIFGTLVAAICSSLIPTANTFIIYITGLLIKYASLTISQCCTEIIFLEICTKNVKFPLIVFTYACIPVAKMVSHYLYTAVYEWRLAELTLQWPIVLIFFGIMFLPESPRWLISKGQYLKAWNVLWEMGSDEAALNKTNILLVLSTSEILRIFVQKQFIYKLLFVSFMIAVANLAVVTDILNSLSNTTKENMHYVEVVLIIAVGSLSYYVAKEQVITGILIFLATCYVVSIASSSRTIEYITLLATTTTSRTITPLLFVYIMEITATTHKATAKGCAVAANTVSKYVLLVCLPIEMTYEAHTILRSTCACLCSTGALLMNFRPTPPLRLQNEI